MRKFLFFLLTVCLLMLITARALLPESAAAQTVMADGHSYGYNLLALDLSLVPETAGSALLAQLNAYYLFRTPTAKSAYSDALEGKNLILICADSWKLAQDVDKSTTPTLYRLWQEGVQFSDVYRPDWYQGMDGREFALLTGLVPTTIDGESSLLWVGEQDVYLPYALGQALKDAGYTCWAFSPDATHAQGYEAMGFSQVITIPMSAQASLEQTFSLYASAGDGPFFAYYMWSDATGESALAYLMTQLRREGLDENTAICLLTGGEGDDRAHLFLWADGLTAAVDKPCSELDVSPTLLNLLGIDFDSRFLSGADVFSQNASTGTANDAAALVSLHGSAYSDWVTAAGHYSAQDSTFFLSQRCFDKTEDMTDYVTAINELVYNRYIYTRKAIQMNYFHLILGNTDTEH